MREWDVIVVGGGHAGVEAATAAARRGARVALVTFDRGTIGAMSCNPAIGGIGKGHLVREVDAFDGVIGRAADAAAIHYRMLNRSKGLAVRGPRIQADRRRFASAVQTAVASEPNLVPVDAEVVELLTDGEMIAGVRMAEGSSMAARSVVLAAGTFLSARMFRGEERAEGGRVNERAATRLGEQLRSLGLPIGRLKTGTPPRLDGRTIDWGGLDDQPSDVDPWTMSPMTRRRVLPQLACAITRTTARSHEIIRAELDRSPLFSGAIDAAGPRYCPSIEDKIRRFADRESHQVFLEPEGLDDPLVYPNGISTSLPTDVQERMIQSMPGLERAHIVVPGYAVEYDHIDPRVLDHRLSVRTLRGLFCAGQINGTTGYEEAAAQGLVAGLNAAGHALGASDVIFDRAESYIGVMIDDLVLQGVTEPYRMLTARAEYRLHLRADNAETRLSAAAIAAGCVSKKRRRHIDQRLERRARAAERLAAMAPTEVASLDINALAVEAAEAAILSELVEDTRYAPYVERTRQALRQQQHEIALGSEIRFEHVPGLSSEMVQRLTAARPASLSEAARIRGISPAAITALMLHAKRAA